MNPAGMYVNTAVVTAKAWSVGNDGCAVVSGSLAGSSFACSIQPKSSSEGLDMGRDKGTKQAVMYCPATTVIDQDDIVTSGGLTYRVIGPPRDAGGRGVFYVVDLEQEV